MIYVALLNEWRWLSLPKISISFTDRKKNAPFLIAPLLVLTCWQWFLGKVQWMSFSGQVGYSVSVLGSLVNAVSSNTAPFCHFVSLVVLCNEWTTHSWARCSLQYPPTHSWCYHEELDCDMESSKHKTLHHFTSHSLKLAVFLPGLWRSRFKSRMWSFGVIF